MHNTKRVHPIIYILVTNKLTTYHELKYNCTIEDMLDLYEICMTNLYNKSQIAEEAAERSKAKK